MQRDFSVDPFESLGDSCPSVFGQQTGPYIDMWWSLSENEIIVLWYYLSFMHLQNWNFNIDSDVSMLVGFTGSLSCKFRSRAVTFPQNISYELNFEVSHELLHGYVWYERRKIGTRKGKSILP
ncbi:hypothetical protein PanWU01x14_035720 [Parasponia andersonii]|uniref:Uncharacterized protein n=1 Tax=Parasponia andersonii TaxID=3476 RepID=A0A2P5DTB3_PARAD|nr:hypothetical protein PanWU01x14_035720 [Parasponia andersonii]